MNATEILKTAADIVGGARQKTHGDKERSFRAIAGLWSAYDECKPRPHKDTSTDVAFKMALLKIARALQGDSTVVDHYVDAAGYIGLAGELALTADTAELDDEVDEDAVDADSLPAPTEGLEAFRFMAGSGRNNANRTAKVQAWLRMIGILAPSEGIIIVSPLDEVRAGPPTAR